jgi:hypothetical protein
LVVRDGERLILQCYLAALAASLAVILLRHLKQRWKYRRRKRPAAEPRCATCDYIILPGSSVICPECGRDLREFGIVTATTLPANGPLPWLALAGLLVLPPALWLASLVERRQPFGWEFNVSRWFYLPPAHPWAPADDARLVVQASGQGRYFGKHPEFVLVYEQSSRLRPLKDLILVRGRDLTHQVMGEGGRGLRDEPLTPEVVQAYVDRVAPGASTEARRGVAADIHAYVRAVARGDFPSRDEWVSDPLPRWSVGYNLGEGASLVVTAVIYVMLLTAAFVAWRRAIAAYRRRLRWGWRTAADRLSMRY